MPVMTSSVSTAGNWARDNFLDIGDALVNAIEA